MNNAKKYLFLIILGISFVVLSCKKKDSPVSSSVHHSNGNRLVLIVSDASLEGAYEFNITSIYDSATFDNQTPEYSDVYPFYIVDAYGPDADLMIPIFLKCKGYSVALFKHFAYAPYTITALPNFEEEEWPEIDYGLDWIAPSELSEGSAESTLNAGDIYCMYGTDQNWTDGWEKVKHLSIVRHYRYLNPNCKVGFMRLADPEGGHKTYFFLGKEQ